MNNSKEIIMIYANAQKKDIGVLQDYSFDMCYGYNENNFECKLQKYNPAFKGSEPIDQDFILYIEFTEYGGIVDSKVVNSKTGEITLSGRTWHGFLNSHIIEPPKGEAYREYRGEANSVLSQIFTDIGMTDWFEASDEDSGIIIRNTEVRYAHAYDFILDILEAEDAKLVLSYRSAGVTGGKIFARAISRVNTGTFEDFDTSQTPFVAGEAYNKVNELICLGPGDGVDRAVIHLFMNKNGSVVPYCRTGGGFDGDYYTDIDALASSPDPYDRQVYNMIQDIITPSSERYTEVFDYPNAEIKKVYNHIFTRPKKWKSIYPDYFYLNYTLVQGEIKSEIKQFERKYEDRYEALKGKPSDWKSHYKDYYMKEKNSSTLFKKVEELSESQGAVIKYVPNGGMQSVDANTWKNYFETDDEDKEDLYYERVGMTGQEFKKVEPVQKDTYIRIGSKRPFDWKENYGSYYLRVRSGTGYDYIPVPGKQKTSYEILTGEPYDWEESYGNYYMKATQTVFDDTHIYERIKKGTYIKISDGVREGMIDDYHYRMSYAPDDPPEKVMYPKWKTRTFYQLVTITDPPKYMDGIWDINDDPEGEPRWAEGPYYKETVYKAPTFVAGKYYQKYVDGTPKWSPPGQGDNDFGGYFKKKEHVEIIPNFYSYQVYFQTIDRYHELCMAGVKRLKELTDKDTLDVSLELESSYDVGDIIGGKDEETGINTIKPIKRKIIKIKKGILSIDYEVD